MVPLAYTNSGARIAFYVVFVAFALLEARVRLRSRLNQQGSRSDRGSFLAVYFSIVAGLVGGFVLAADVHAAAIPVARWPLFVAGIALMVAGIAIRQWAVAVLGQFFTTDVRVHRGQTVVENGPYRWVRHPSYTGLEMTTLGLGLALGNWAALAALVILSTAGLVYRIRVEELALRGALGERYSRFAVSRSRLIPRIW